jgi:hypothetical protein
MCWSRLFNRTAPATSSERTSLIDSSTSIKNYASIQMAPDAIITPPPFKQKSWNDVAQLTFSALTIDLPKAIGLATLTSSFIDLSVGAPTSWWGYSPYGLSVGSVFGFSAFVGAAAIRTILFDTHENASPSASQINNPISWKQQFLITGNGISHVGDTAVQLEFAAKSLIRDLNTAGKLGIHSASLLIGILFAIAPIKTSIESVKNYNSPGRILSNQNNTINDLNQFFIKLAVLAEFAKFASMAIWLGTFIDCVFDTNPSFFMDLSATGLALGLLFSIFAAAGSALIHNASHENHQGKTEDIRELRPLSRIQKTSVIAHAACDTSEGAVPLVYAACTLFPKHTRLDCALMNSAALFVGALGSILPARTGAKALQIYNEREEKGLISRFTRLC